MAGIGIAASPEPARGATPRHLAWTVLGAVTIAVWPAFAARRASPRLLILSVYGSAAATAVFGPCSAGCSPKPGTATSWAWPSG